MNGDDLRGPAFCSWSGGKDSALALHEAIAAGAEPRFLISMLTEGGERSRSHGLARELLEAQAAAVGVPIRFGAATWPGYREAFVRVLGEGVAATGARLGVFGDIDIDDHQGWVEDVCAEVRARAALPLWHRDRREVVDELLGVGFEAVIVAVRDGVLPASLLGRTLDPELVAEIEAAGADACGEASSTPWSSTARSSPGGWRSSAARRACATASGSSTSFPPERTCAASAPYAHHTHTTGWSSGLPPLEEGERRWKPISESIR